MNPAMRVINEQAPGDGLKARREVKYPLPGADVGKLRRLLEGSCRRVAYNARVSVVRSIYFDDWRLAACHENLGGVGKRRKVRLRWYDQPFPQDDFFFEIKWRNNCLTGKHRLGIGTLKPLSELSYGTIISDLTHALPEQYAEVLLWRPEPVVLVEYKREHFLSRDGQIRVTLDYNLVFYDQTGRHRPSLRFGVPMHDMVVLEGKTSSGQERALRGLLYPLAPRAARCSKYVHGCRLLGLMGRATPSFD